MVTTILDLLGSVLFLAGVAWFAGTWLGIAAALCIGGLGLLGLSWIIDRKQKGDRR